MTVLWSCLRDHRGGPAGFEVNFSDHQIVISDQQAVVYLTDPDVLVWQSLRDKVEAALPMESPSRCEFFHCGARRLFPLWWRWVVSP